MTATLSPLFTWRSAIVESEVSHRARHIALTLSMHMSERGESCMPTLVTLCQETGRGKTTVIEAIRELEAAGWLHVQRKEEGKPGRGDRNHYSASFPEGFTPGPFLQKRVLGLQRKGPENGVKGPVAVPKDVKDVKDDEGFEDGLNHKCPQCGIRFKGPRTLAAHLRNVHDEVPA